MDKGMFQELLARVRTGESEAVKMFLDEFKPDLYRELRMLLTDPNLRTICSESDLVQSIVFAFYLRLTLGQFDFDEPGQVIACLRTIATNKIHNLTRQQQAQRRDVRRRKRNGERVLETILDTAASPLNHAAARDFLRELLKRLPENLRKLAIARGHGRTWTELAAELNVSADSLRKQFDRALDEALEQMQPENLDP